MSRTLSTILILTVAGLAASADPNPIAVKLDGAKKTYEADLKSANTAVLDSLEKREEAARKEGNKKLVDQIKAERQAFIDTEECPLTALIKFEERIAAARKKMAVAYKVAIQEYTKAKND